MTVPFTTQSLQDALTAKLALNFGTEPGEATDQEMLKACALVLRDVMALRGVQTEKEKKKEQKKQVHYLSLEFLMGRSLMKNAYNLGVLPELKEALGNLGFKSGDLFELEPDAGLGNGGLGRLAACYLDSMTTLEIPATGYSICYELGIFKQKIVEGQQVELPDDWKGVGSAWLLPKPDEAQAVHFGGTLREFWHDGHLHIVNENSTTVLAVPCDMVVAGYDTDHVNTLRLWDARSTRPVDMALFSRGEYLKASEDEAMAETIAKVLYPEDNHYEGKSLRLKQQYFFVSATVQSIVTKHLETYGTLKNFHEKNIIQINDTHPALVIPELMRIFMDEAGMNWDEAWDITSRSVAYTNHTVLSEALERWPQQLVETLLPRVWQIIQEIARRWQEKVENFFHDPSVTEKMAIVWGGEVRMANLCVAGGLSVNGVSGLHSEILKKTIFHDFYKHTPGKFTNVTNGIAHRRWLCYSNPQLTALIDECIGDTWHKQPERLESFARFADDASVLQRIEKIKRANKVNFAIYTEEKTGIKLDPDSVFDVQIKRMHEYKRQLLNALRIISLYVQLKENPDLDITPQTFIFGAKAAPGYYMAKNIIKLICYISADIEKNPKIREKLRVIFMEDYNVSLAEVLIPAADISEQISLAGKEASGTGCMKLMANGAITIGTMDGANVEMYEHLGADNIYIFGLTTEEVDDLWKRGYYATSYYLQSEKLRAAVDALDAGFNGRSFGDMKQYLVNPQYAHGVADPYMCLADFDSYTSVHDAMLRDYSDKKKWDRMSLINTAKAGYFSADRSIREYADNIWHIRPIK